MNFQISRLAVLATILATLALLVAPTVVSKTTSDSEANRGQSEAIATSTESVETEVARETAVEPVLNPALVPVCTCESGRGTGKPQQFNPDGSVRLGEINPHDIGMCQINSDYHEAKAVSLGMDIYTTNGNIRYANWLYAREGLTPWNWSKSCWAE